MSDYFSFEIFFVIKNGVLNASVMNICRIHSMDNIQEDMYNVYMVKIHMDTRCQFEFRTLLMTG